MPTSNRRFSCTLIATGVALACLLVSGPSRASSITTTLTPFFGAEIELELTLWDDAGDGAIHGRLEVSQHIGDIRGLFLNFDDPSVLSGLSVTGADVTHFATSGVIGLGGGNVLDAPGTPCPCDLGISFGTPGTIPDDIQSTEFVLSHPTSILDLSLFGDQLVGAVVDSVGNDDLLDRQGRSQLIGRLEPVPEPGTAVLLGLGLLGLALAGRSR